MPDNKEYKQEEKQSDEERIRQSEEERTKLELSDDKKKELIKWYESNYSNIKNEEVSIEDSIAEYEKLYNQVVTPKSFPWKDASNYFVPLIPMECDIVSSILLSTITGIQPMWLVTAPPGSPDKMWTPTEGITGYEKVKMVEEWLQFTAIGIMHLDTELDLVISDTAMKGIAFLEPYWLHKKEKQYVYKKTGLFRNKQKKELVELTTEYRPAVDVLDRRDVIIPSGSRTLDVNILPWVIIRRYVSTPTMIARFEREEYSGKVEFEKIRKAQPDKNYWEVHELWKYEDIDNDGIMENCVFYMLPMAENGKTMMLRSSLSPYLKCKRPLIPFRIKNKPNSFEGLGIAEMNKSSQYEINALHNQRIDNAAITINKAVKVKRGSYAALYDIPIYPGARIPVNSPDDVTEFQFGDVNLSSYREEELTARYAELRAGIGSFTAGRESGADPRASGVKIQVLNAQANIRINNYLKTLMPSMRELADWIVSLSYQYMPPKMEYYILGNDGMPLIAKNKGKITKSELEKDILKTRLDFVMQGNTISANKDMERQNELFKFETIMNNPLIQNPEALGDPRTKKIFYMMLRRLLVVWGEKNVDEILPPLEEYVPKEGGEGQEGQMTPEQEQYIQEVMQKRGVAGAETGGV